MSKTKLTPVTQLPRYTEVHMKKVIPVRISEALFFKIKYLCHKINKDEWSGTLFYKSEGKITDKKFKIECVDLMPQNHGTPGWTEFKFDGSFADYMMQNPHLMECSMGLIH